MSVVTTNLDLELVARGKVRDLYSIDAQTLLFVATDRISAYDVVMDNGIPDKGVLLTKLSLFWFNLLRGDVANHLVSPAEDVWARLPLCVQPLKARSLIVHKYRILPLEIIVRGYITGSAWAEYRKHGTVHGIPVPAGMRESEKFPEPLYTPSTKAAAGLHDENIHPSEAAKLIGADLAASVQAMALALYSKAHEHARERGIILADTKFEFGVDDDSSLVLVDEVLTPDSSRFWPAHSYSVGRPQVSYDKQFLRDWLVSQNLQGRPGVSMPQSVVDQTRAKYIEAYECLTGVRFD